MPDMRIKLLILKYQLEILIIYKKISFQLKTKRSKESTIFILQLTNKDYPFIQILCITFHFLSHTLYVPSTFLVILCIVYFQKNSLHFLYSVKNSNEKTYNLKFYLKIESNRFSIKTP